MKSSTYDILTSLVTVILVLGSIIIPLIAGLPLLCLLALLLTLLWIIPQKMIVRILKNQEEMRRMLEGKADE